MSDLDDLYNSSGGKAAKFAEVGDSIEGQIIRLEKKQLPSYDNENELDTWPDGGPKYTYLLTLQTDEEDGEDDDGRRVVYCRSGLHTALRDALGEAGNPGMDVIVGSRMHVEFDSTKASANKRYNARKLYSMRFDRKTEPPVNVDDGRPAGGDDDDIPF